MTGDEGGDVPARRRDRQAVFQREARTRLADALRERNLAKAALDQTDAALREAVRDAEAAGVTLNEIAELTGWHRNTIRRIVAD